LVPFGNTTTVASLVRRAAALHRDRLAIIDGDRRITYGQLGERSNRLANALIGLGLTKGDRVGILSSNRAEYIEIDFALAKAGLVRVPLYARNSPREHLHFIEDSQLNGLIVESKLMGDLVEATNGRPDEAVAVLVSMGKSEFPCHEYEELIAQASGTDPAVPVAGSDLCQIRYTAGTTGLPKGAATTHVATATAVLGNVYAQSHDGGLRAEERILHLSPFSHAGGFFVPGHSWVGMTHVIMHGWDAEMFLRLVQEEHVSATLVVPTMISVLIEQPELLDRYDVSSLRCFSYSAAPIAPTLLERAVERFGAVFNQGWGLSESPSFCTLLPSGDHRLSEPELLSSCGFALPWVDLEILDDDGQPLPPGEVGEIAVRGPQLMEGYVGQPEATARALEGGWLTTGDVGTIDERGYMYIRDRKGYLIISGGFNIWPAEVEDALATHPAVVECAVVGMPDEKWGDIVCAVVRCKLGQRPTEQELTDHCRLSLASYKKPKQVIIVDEPLPKSEAGKIAKSDIKALVESLRPATP